MWTIAKQLSLIYEWLFVAAINAQLSTIPYIENHISVTWGYANCEISSMPISRTFLQDCPKYYSMVSFFIYNYRSWKPHYEVHWKLTTSSNHTARIPVIVLARRSRHCYNNPDYSYDQFSLVSKAPISFSVLISY